MVALPNLVGAGVEPSLALISDSGRRRAIVVGGGIAFAIALGAAVLATDFPSLLVPALLLGPASGAFVGLSQASLMDLDPLDHERNMVRWTLAGWGGVLMGPLALAGSAVLGFGWRGLLFALAALTVPLVLLARRAPLDSSERPRPFAEVLAAAIGALRRLEVARWLILLEVSDLMGDVLYGFLALYFVDVARVNAVTAGLAVAVWSAAGLLGNALLLPILARMPGVRYARMSALAAMGVFPAFLIASGTGAKVALLAPMGLIVSGWYPVLKARLFTELRGSSGIAVALSDLSGLVGQLSPVMVGVLAQRFGLGAAMWVLLIAPVALLIGLPRTDPSRSR